MKKGYHKTKDGKVAKKGLWYNIAKKKKAGKKMRKKGDKGAPAKGIFTKIAKAEKKKKKTKKRKA